MKKISVSLSEQETTINRYPKAASEWVEFYTCIPAEMKKYKKFAEENPEEFIIEKEDEIGIFGKAKANWYVGLRRPIKRKPRTEEQKLASVQGLIRAREAKKNQTA